MADITKKKTKHIFYLDALRAIAILSVLLVHVTNDLRVFVVSDYAILSTNWILHNFLYCFSRWGVGLFLVISGALLLGRNEDLKTFLSKRIPRIVVPFVFWGFVLSVFLICISYFAPEFFSVIGSFDVYSILIYFYRSFAVDNLGFTPYWFFWMIFGVYLVLPIFNKWIRHSDLKEVEYFLVIWLITCLFDCTLFVEFPITLTYFSGPIGLVVLGYYLTHTERKLLNNPYFGLALFIVSYLLLVILTFIFSSTELLYNIDRYSIIVVAEIIGIFIFAKNFDKLNINVGSDNVLGKAVSSLALYSYGIYLIHRVFLVLLGRIFIGKLPYPQTCLVLYILTLIISWGILAILNRVPYLNEVIGVK